MKMAFERKFLSGLEYMVLLSILSKGESYGVAILDEIQEVTGKKLSYGAIYKALKTLSAKGFLDSRKGGVSPERGGRAKTFYMVNANGRKALDEYEHGIKIFKWRYAQQKGW